MEINNIDKDYEKSGLVDATVLNDAYTFLYSTKKFLLKIL